MAGSYKVFVFLLCVMQIQCSTPPDISITVAEMANIGSVLTNIPHELKWPSTERRTYTILSSTQGYTKVGRESGIVKVKKQMDREELCPDNREHCYVDVTVAVLVSNRRTPKLVRIRIEVTDINDNVPKFENEVIEKMMSEAVDVHTSIRLDSAVDPDYGSNSIQGYQLISTNGPRSKDKFFELETINSIDGTKIPKLKLRKGLDRERKGVHELLLEAFDGGTPALTGTATVRINITDDNDNFPKFEQETYSVDVEEHEAEGTNLIQVVAKDKDVGLNGMIVYKFPSGVSAEEREIFNLDPDTGVISIKNSNLLDFETRNIHHLTVEATDMGPNPVSAYATVTVTVKDVNDNKPQVEVKFVSSESVQQSTEGSEYDAVIMEDIEVEQYIAFVTITDKDGGNNGSASCSIPKDGIFSLIGIDESEGRFVLQIDRTLDRERKSSYDLPIDAWDLGTPPQTNTRVLKLKVGDVNDNAPRFFRKEFEAKVSETAKKGTVVSSLQAKDPDESPGPNSNVTYSLMRRSDFVTKNGVEYPLTSVFNINPVSGEVRLAIDNVLDAEVETQPGGLIVLARDNGIPSLNTTTKLKITVIDENDNSPVFEEQSYSFEVEEHSSDGRYIGQVVAKDDDVSETNGQITYTIERLQPGSRTAPPGYENLWVDMFQVEARTGFIHFYGNRTKLDREAYNGQPITISVVATDDGSPRRRAEASVSIKLKDINDNKPMILSPDGWKDIGFVRIITGNSEGDDELSENADLGGASSSALRNAPSQSWASVVIYEESNASDTDGYLPITLTRVEATDMDEGKNALLNYAISAGDDNRYFKIDPTEGNITFADDVDMDKIKLGCHVLKILVSDLGETKQLHSDAYVNLFLSRDGPEDVNITEAMKECKSNPLFPKVRDDSVSFAGFDQSTIYIFIGFGALIFIILLVIVIVLIKCHCCDKHKKSRSYNCQQGKSWNNSSGYGADDSKRAIRKRGSSRRSYNGQGTVDSRSSFHSEWTASQTQIALEKTEKVRVLPDLPSVGSQESHNVPDSGTGDSVSGDAYHPATYSEPPDHQTYLPNHDGQYIHPHNSMSPMQYGSPMNELPSHQMGYMEHPGMYSRTLISTKCTQECLIFGHGDHCWMPDSLLRAQAQGPIEMMQGGNPDRVVFQNHPDHGLRYHGDPNTPYYYDPGQKFSQLSSNEGSEHLSYSKGHGDDGYHHHAAGDGLQHHPSFQHPVMHAPSPHPHQMMYQNEQERAYINLQGYDPTQNQPEEMHSNLSSASSNNNPYGAALPQNNQRYRPEPNHPQMFYPSQGNSRYDMMPTTQGYMPPIHDPGQIHYSEDYSASNLLPSVTNGPVDYGHHWDHNRSIPAEQQPLLNRQDYPNPNRSGRTSNPKPEDQERLLNQNSDSDNNSVPKGDGQGQSKVKDEKLSTIAEQETDINTHDGVLL